MGAKETVFLLLLLSLSVHDVFLLCLPQSVGALVPNINLHISQCSYNLYQGPHIGDFCLPCFILLDIKRGIKYLRLHYLLGLTRMVCVP